jgi:hypothetical protein
MALRGAIEVTRARLRRGLDDLLKQRKHRKLTEADWREAWVLAYTIGELQAALRHEGERR